MAQEKTFDRADLLRYFHETERDGLVGRLTVIHPPTPQQLAFDQEATQGEVRRYPVVCETTALYCERYGFSVVVQQVTWPDGGDQYLGHDHPLRVLTRERRAITRYGSTSSQLSRWASELADAFRDEVAGCIPADPLDLLALRRARQEDPHCEPLYPQHVDARCALPETEPADPLIEQEQEADADVAPESDPDHNATGETMDDFLSGLDSDGDSQEG